MPSYAPTKPVTRIKRKKVQPVLNTHWLVRKGDLLTRLRLLHSALYGQLTPQAHITDAIAHITALASSRSNSEHLAAFKRAETCVSYALGLRIPR